jgi:DNA-binding response OmpR family regulator
MDDIQCLLLTRDPQVERVVRPVLANAQVGVEVCFNAAQVGDLLQKRHFDGFVLDCDEIPDAANLIEKIRGFSSNHAVIMAVTKGEAGGQTALYRGANFVLDKPLSQDRLESYLHIALVFLNREFRRYFRYRIQLPVTISVSGKEITAKTRNISEGGVGLQLSQPNPSLRGAVDIRFEIPDPDKTMIRATGEIAWSDKSGQVGMRITHFAENCGQALRRWLGRLETRNSED